MASAEAGFFENAATLLRDALSPFGTPLLILYLLVISVVSVYGLHRYWLVYLFARHGRDAFRPRVWSKFDDEEPAPRVTVQLPMFNEDVVARRAIEAACALDYPRDRLEIQVLDDSTGESARLIGSICDELRQAGFPVVYLHRRDRHGFKAGALEAGLRQATGEFIAVFDADFVPPPDLLLRTIPYFRDRAVGMVQTRWAHLNRADSWLTRSQAVLLDGHFVIEHTARHGAGRWFNFNGTAGVWRRSCIEDAGGWQHDTLTEDVDLSYRAQLRGWKFVYDPTIECPGELPPCVSAFKSQQHRWTKGSVQTSFKLLPAILRSAAPMATKLEAWFHLTSPIVYVCVVLLSLLFFPAYFVKITPVERGAPAAWFFGLTVFALATASAGSFYVVSQRVQQRSLVRAILQIPALLALGVGISVNNARAVLEASLGIRSPFIRTPKFNGTRTASIDPVARRRRRTGVPAGLVELALGILMLLCVALALTQPYGLVSVPFLLIFAAGYLAVGLGQLQEHVRGVS